MPSNVSLASAPGRAHSAQSLPRALFRTALLCAAGAGLLSSQYVAARELGSTFFVTELSIIAATVVTLIGPSLSYALGDRLRGSDRLLQWWALAALLIQLALPFGIRALVGSLGASHPLWAAAITASAVALLCGYYAFILPLYAEPASLPRLYAAELGGALLTLLLLAVAPSYRLFLPFFLLLPVLIAWLTQRRLVALCTLLLAGAVSTQTESLDRWASTHYYRHYHQLDAPRVIESVYSPYQRIDVVEAAADTALYLDGVPFYRSGDLDSFNVFLAELPGSLLPKRGRALVVGSGSFSSAARLHRLGYRVTVIELDALVAKVGFHRFAHLHKLSPEMITLHIDDARRVLATHSDSYDLIVLDVPAPYRIATALLHSPEFYRQVAARLTPTGVVALSLCDDLAGSLGKRIAASAAQVFAEIMVVESSTVGLGVLYGGAQLPFSIQAAAEQLRARDPQGGQVTPDQLVRSQVLDADPLGPQDLLGVLLLSRQVVQLP